MPTESMPSVLCVDADRDIAEIVEAVLSDEGYVVSCLYLGDDDVLQRTIGQLEPDCVLLDGGSPFDYDQSWREAAALTMRHRRIPVVMFTAHAQAVAEARDGESARSKAADFVEIVNKPFHLDELIAAVANATGRSVPFDRSDEAEAKRTAELVAALVERGATEIETSKRREWATFRDKRGHLCQMYWWQLRGVYQVGRYHTDGRMRMIGQFVDRDAAIEAALPPV